LHDYSRLDALPGYNSSTGRRLRISKLNRTITDVYQDELHNPAQAQRVPKQLGHQEQNLLASLYRNPLDNRPSAQTKAICLCETGNSYDCSPFRRNSLLRRNLIMMSSHSLQSQASPTLTQELAYSKRRSSSRKQYRQRMQYCTISIKMKTNHYHTCNSLTSTSLTLLSYDRTTQSSQLLGSSRWNRFPILARPQHHPLSRLSPVSLSSRVDRRSSKTALCIKI
jgi:hypothetical protein